MTRTETIKIMAMLAALYGQGKADPEQMATAWALVLADYDYNDAAAAVIEFARNDRRDYATFPAPGRIVEQIEATQTRRAQAVNEAYRQIAYGRGYDTLSADARALIDEDTYAEWLRIDPVAFAEQAAHYKAVLRVNQLKLIGGGDRE